jgi:imidazolonepropionase-like amidohydrolase
MQSLRSSRTLLSAILLVALSAVAQAQTVAADQAVVLRGARVIDGAAASPIDNAAIVIRDGRILAIGPAASITPPAGASVIDYSGKTIIPGLISAHSHVGIFAGVKSAPENYNRNFILQQLRQFEAYGVTAVTALGLNGPLFYELREDLHSGRVAGADLFGADQGVGVVGGQPAAAVVVVADNQITRPDSEERARLAIREMAARKTDLVKIWLDGAGGLMPKIKPEVYSAVIDEAHKNGLRVAAHIYDLDDAKAIVRAGVDIIAHGVRDKPVDAEFIDMLKARSVWYIATIGLDESTYIFAEQPAWTKQPFVQRVMHPSVRALLDDPAYRERTLAATGTGKARAAVANNKQNLKTLHDAGVRIGFGSDSGVGLRFPGVAEHRELALSVEAGLNPMQALTLATSNAAALLKLEDRGVLAAGKLANLVVLDGDPTTDIGNSKKIHAVWHRGREAAGPVEAFSP